MYRRARSEKNARDKDDRAETGDEDDKKGEVADKVDYDQSLIFFRDRRASSLFVGGDFRARSHALPLDYP